MKIVSSLVCLALCIFLSSKVTADEFEDGAPEYDTVVTPYTEAEIQKQIQNEMQVACKNNLCTLIGTDGKGSQWSASFNVGVGQPQNGNGGDNIYIGGNPGNSNDVNYYAGITVSYKNYKCHSELKVTPAIYRFVNTYLYNMVNSDGSTKKAFSPADQTVLLFYTTLLSKVENCKPLN